MLLERGVNSSAYEALRYACRNGHTEIVRLLLAPERGVNPAADGNAALSLAIRGGHTEIVRLLKAKIPWYRRLL
jgi:ankyrin repeat protein